MNDLRRTASSPTRAGARIAALAMLCLGMLDLGSTAQSTWYVDAAVALSGDGTTPAQAFLTIQEGIDAAVAGDTVQVAVGDYVLATPLVLDRSIALLGGQQGIDARGRVVGLPSSTTESIVSSTATAVVLAAGAAGATIDGFSFVAAGRVLDSSAGGALTLDGLAFRNNHAESTGAEVCFIDVDAVDLTIEHNVFLAQGTAAAFALAAGDQGGFRLLGNHLLRTTLVAGSAGLRSNGIQNLGPSVSRAPLIAGNRFEGHDIGLDLGLRSFFGGDIEENEFVGNGIGLGFGPQNATIRRNVFDSNLDRGIAFGDGAMGDPAAGAQDCDVLENLFLGQGSADLAIADGQANGTLTTIVLRANSFASATAIRNDDTLGTLLDAGGNAFGDGSGPSTPGHPSGTGAAIAGTAAALVDFSPWLVDSGDQDGMTPGFQGNGALLAVDDDSPQVGAIGRIEEAIVRVDAGGDISVGPGQYDEGKTLVDKTVTIIGPGLNLATVRAVEDTQNSPSDARAWYLVSGADVAIRDLEFDGRRNAGRTIHQAFRLLSGTTTIERCRFKDVRGGPYNGIAVAAFRDASIVDCEFSGIERVGVIFFGALVANGSVSGMNYTGKGIGDQVDYAVEVSAGAQVTISSTVIHACSGKNLTDNFESSAILASTFFGPGTRVDIDGGCDLVGNSIAVQVGFGSADSTWATVTGCDLSGNSLYGLSVSGDAARVRAEANDLRSCGDAGIAVRFGALCDAGNCGADVTGLGASAGGNLLGGYGFDDLAPFAIRQDNLSGQSDVRAAANDFGLGSAADDVEKLIRDAIDDPSRGGVLYTNSVPFIQAPGDQTVSCIGDVPSGSATLAAFRSAGGIVSSNDLTAFGFTDTIVGGPSSVPGTHQVVRNYAMTDACGGNASATQTFDVVDTTAPVAAALATPLVVVLDASSGLHVLDPGELASLAVGSSDDCSSFANLQIVATPSAFDCSDVGFQNVQITVVDEAGNPSANTAVAVVEVIDQSFPIVSGCPASIVVGTDPGSCSAIVSWTPPSATDNCMVSASSSHVPGDTFALGTTQVSYAFADPSGQISTCVFDVTVTDDEAPVLTCPSDLTVAAETGLCGATIAYSTAATDNCSLASLVQTSGLASGAFFPVGSTVCTFTAMDAAGNTTSCSFTLTVADLEAPAFVSCPGDQTLAAPTGQCSAVATWTAPATSDNCPGESLVQTAGLPSGSAFPVGSTLTTFVVTDAAGNSATCSFTITVLDLEPPVLAACPADQHVEAPLGSATATVTWATPSFTDNCPGATLSSSIASGSPFPVGTTTVALVVTDAAGLTASCSFTVTVAADFEAPQEYSTLGPMAPPVSQPLKVVFADMGDGMGSRMPDGAPDLVVALFGHDALAILYNDGLGAFPILEVVDVSAAGIGPVALAVGDFDGVGGMDLATVARDSDALILLLNDGSNLSIQAPLDLQATLGLRRPTAIIAGDLDGVGRDDIVVTAVGDIFGVGQGVATVIDGAAPTIVAKSGGFRRPTDLDLCARPGDSTLDLVVAERAPGSASQNLVLFENDGSGLFNEASLHLDAPEQITALRCADLDGTGIADDIVVCTRPALPIVPGVVRVFVRNGLPGFDASAFDLPFDLAGGLSTVALAAGDLQADTLMPGLICAQDVVAVDGGTNSLIVHRQLDCGTASAASTTAFPTSNVPASAAIGDLNGDGYPDLVVANQGADSVTVRLAIPRARGDAFGTGCPGTPGTPVLSAPSLPVHDTLAQVHLANALPSAPVLLAVAIQANPQIIAPGCINYLQAPVILFNLTSMPDGSVSFSFQVPQAPNFTGASLFMQAAVFDPGGTLLGQFALSNALRIRVGF